MRHLILALAAALLLAGCDSPTGPDPNAALLPPESEPFDPPAYYARWWTEMAACVGVDASMDRVTFYAARDGRRTNWRVETQDGEEWIAGLWVPPHDIYINAHRTGNEWLVKHEMIHDLTQSGSEDHPAHERCNPKM